MTQNPTYSQIWSITMILIGSSNHYRQNKDILWAFWDHNLRTIDSLATEFTKKKEKKIMHQSLWVPTDIFRVGKLRCYLLLKKL